MWSVIYLLNGARIVTGSGNKTIRICDPESGTKPLMGHNRDVTSVAYSPDGQHIISGSDDGTIRIWDTEAHTTARKPPGEHTHSARSITYPLMGSTPFFGLMTTLSMHWTHFHILLSDLPLVSQCILVFV